MKCFISLNEYFIKELNKLDCEDEVKAYIVSIFSHYKHADNDLSKQSITIEYTLAISKQDFERFQKIGDYLFFANSMFPESLNGASKEYYYSIAKSSYLNCYKQFKQFKIYKLLSNNFIYLSTNSGKIISHKE